MKQKAINSAFSFLLVLMLICTLFPKVSMSASAETSGTCGPDLTWSVDTSTGVLTISGSGAMYDYSCDYISGKSTSPWNSHINNIKTLSIEGDVTSIGNAAFAGLKLTGAVIGDGVLTVGNKAFFRCSVLNSVTIPESVQRIGTDAFTYCTLLAQVNISDLAAWCSIDFKDFYANPLTEARRLYLNGTLVTDLVIPEGVTGISKYAFSHCQSLTSVTIPSSVTSIGIGAFYYCGGISSITVPEHVEKIEASVFYGCAGLTNVIIPEGVSSIGENAFFECTGLTNVTLPSTMSSIGEYAFYKCNHLSNITIPSSLYGIGDGAFYNCSSLACITISRGELVTDGLHIDDTAFYGCTALSGVYLSDIADWCSINFIDNNYLQYAHNLYLNGSLVTDLVIPEGVARIGNNAFFEYSSLTSVTIPESLTSIGTDAFFGCSSLDSVYISDIGRWCVIDFRNINANPLSYANRLFLNGSLVTDLVIPGSVSSIGNCAFSRYTRLSSVTISTNVKNIGDYSFYGCTGLTNVSIPKGVICIGHDAFSGCSGLIGSLVIPDSVTAIGNCAFEYCSGLTGITIPSSVMSVGSLTFLGCSGVEKLNADSAWIPVWFQNQSALKEIEIGPHVQTIDANAFSGCTALTKVTMQEGITSIGTQAFSSCTHLTRIAIPSSVTSFGSNVFEGCTYLHDLRLGVHEIPRSMLDCCYSKLSHVTVTDPDCFIEYDTNTLGVPGQTVIYGHRNSTAETYARAFSYSFIALEEHTHDYSDTVTLPTCMEQGYTTHFCTCGDSFVDTYIEALGHAFEKGVCSQCGYEAQKASEVFADVKDSNYYAAAVLWAIKNGVTGGTSKVTFSPQQTCTRAQIVTFLWRAAGSPEPTTTINPFADVKSDKYYYKAVLWAAETGVTSGTSDTTFSPNDGCTRAQVVTFLWRFAGSPEPTTTANPFTDVPAGKYYTKAVLWAAEKGVTAGTSETTFSPNDTCTRAQVVTFLYRYMEG